ncbi:GHKL domain-containing protein [Enterococcus ratti]|uniref:GHKL domain-containing protein n=1 Tax=Enterococcus ratti TaxID=150033 RepID=UPI003514C117
MEVSIYILLFHLNFALTWYILLAKNKWTVDILIRLCLMFLNLWLSELTSQFLVLLYIYHAVQIFRENKNIFVAVLLNTFCINTISISIFLTIEFPRLVSHCELGTNGVLQIFLLLIILLAMKIIEQRYQIISYLYSYKKQRNFSVVLFFSFFIPFLLYHTLFPNDSLYFILTSCLLILINSFYELFMLLIVLNEQKEEYYSVYMESMKRNKEYYRKLEEFRHDYKNYIGVLENLLQNNQFKQELEAVVDYEKDFFETQLKDTLHIKLQKIHDPLLQGIFSKFMARAEELKIPYVIQINHIIPKLTINSYDMIRLFTNITENSLTHYESHPAIDRKEIIIKIENLADCFYFEFSNPSKKTECNVTDLLNKGTTRQENSKGIGLYSVKKIIENNENLSLSLKYDRKKQRFYCVLTLRKQIII